MNQSGRDVSKTLYIVSKCFESFVLFQIVLLQRESKVYLEMGVPMGSAGFIEGGAGKQLELTGR